MEHNTMTINKQTLPSDTSLALRSLIKMSERLVNIADRETQNLVQNDLVSFAILQQEKELVSLQYAQAAQEFHDRLEDFRTADESLKNKLEQLQIQLGDKMRSNNKIVERMNSRAKEKTEKTLFTVQELSQMRPVKVNDNERQAAGKQERI